ncbi:RNF4 ligase, partial [Climacteris rufus]|nr:RNF4 ligase [Climacteris rufus]
RKRHGGAVDSTQAQKRSRLLPSSAGGTSQTEPTELEECGTLSFEHEENIIELTGEYSEAEVLPLSDNESAVQDREQNQQQPNVSTAGENSAEPLARDDGEESRDNYEYVREKLHIFSVSIFSSPQPRVVIRCPICLDFYHEIVKSGRLIVATLCGHIFCSRCLPIALRHDNICPTCRRRHPQELFHAVYL